jgi:hypothetical protein
MKRIVLIISAFCFLLPGVDAQQNATPSYILEGPGYTDFYNKVDFLKSLDVSKETYNGSPYLSNDFINSFVYLTNGTVFHDIPLRYNIYNDVFEFGKPEEAWSVDVDFGYFKIKMNNRTFILTPFEYNLGVKKGHMELLADGRYQLLKKFRIDYSPPQPAGAYSSKQPGSFNDQKPDYYLKIDNNTAMPFNNEKSFMKACGCKSRELDSFIKENKINFKKEESLTRLFEFLNKQ